MTLNSSRIMHWFMIEVLSRLGRIEQQMKALQVKENQIMTTAAELLQAATDEATVVDSVVAAIQSLKDAIAGIPNVPADVQKAIDDTFALITSDKTKLAAAITENTDVAVPTVTGEGAVT